MSSVNPQSVRAIAKKDFQDAIRSYLFIGLSVFFFTLLVLATGILSYSDLGSTLVQEGETTAGLIMLVQQITRLVIPLVAIILGWKAIAGERSSGSIKVLLSLPHSRTDVLVGKLIGRSLVLSVSLLVGFVLAAVVVAVMLGAFDVLDYLGLLAMSIIYGVAYTSLAVSASALARSTTLAAAAAFGIFVLFYILWDAVFGLMQLLAQFDYISTESYTITVQGQSATAERLPDWAYFFSMLDPGDAYQNVLTLATSVGDLSPVAQQVTEAAFDGSIPFFLQDWFSFIVLLFWIVIPFAVGLVVFRRADL